jgi:hypothetical protein
MRYLFILIGIAFLSACNISRDEIRDFIPGTYVLDYEQEYSKGHDTLVFKSVSSQGNSYQITRKTSYSRIVNGKLKGREQKKEQMTGIYDEKDKIIYEVKHGKTFAFSPERNIVLSGTEEYKKVY